MKCIRYAAIAVAALALASTASAQAPSTTKEITFGGAGGLNIPFGSWKDDLGANTGFLLQGQVTWTPPAAMFGIRGEVGYSRFGFSQNTGEGTINGHFRQVSFIGNAVVPLAVSGSSVRPYAIGGLGLYNGQASASIAGGTFTADSHTDFGINGGLGMQFALGGASAFIEARIHAIFNGANGNATNNNNSKTELILPITFGFNY